MEFLDKLPNQGPPLLKIASAVARLHGWSGGILMQPWYQWLTTDEILVQGGDSITNAFDDHYDSRNNAGKEGVLYRLPVRANLVPGNPPARHKALPLKELSRRAELYGGVRVGGTHISPDGRWLLFIGDKAGKYLDPPYWVAIAIDGSREVAWAFHRFAKSRWEAYEVPQSQADWLPDSSGILETEMEPRYQQNTVRITGRIRLLDSPTISYPLPPLTIDTRLKGLKYDWGGQRIYPIQRTANPSRTTIGLRRLNVEQSSAPSIVQGGTLKYLPPDRVMIYQWDWQESSSTTPALCMEKVLMPEGYHVFNQSISPDGESIVWALMNRAHHVVVNRGYTLPAQFGTGKISLWVSRRGRSEKPVPIGYLPVPLGKEAYCYQRFGLGDWLPGNQRISFLFDGTLYTVAVP